MKITFCLYDQRYFKESLIGEFDSPVRFNVGDYIDLANIMNNKNITDEEGNPLWPESQFEPAFFIEASIWIIGNGCIITSVSFDKKDNEICQYLDLEIHN